MERPGRAVVALVLLALGPRVALASPATSSTAPARGGVLRPDPPGLQHVPRIELWHSIVQLEGELRTATTSLSEADAQAARARQDAQEARQERDACEAAAEVETDDGVDLADVLRGLGLVALGALAGGAAVALLLAR